jgi:hypothetical protein
MRYAHARAEMGAQGNGLLRSQHAQKSQWMICKHRTLCTQASRTAACACSGHGDMPFPKNGDVFKDNQTTKGNFMTSAGYRACTRMLPHILEGMVPDRLLTALIL